MISKSFAILIIWLIWHFDCFPTVKKNTPENIERLNNLYENELAELYGLQFQGDMVLNPGQLEALESDGIKTGMIRDSYKWPGGIVPYLIAESHFDSGHINHIHLAMNLIENVTCIRFVPFTPNVHKNYIHIEGDKPGCFSAILCQQSGSQVLNIQYESRLNKGYFVLFSIAHEMLHALGFHHMQSARDRNKYVRIVEDNVMENFKADFPFYPDTVITHYGVEYDYGSVMHYSNTAFSFDHHSLTIVPLRDLKGEIMGQRDHLSEKDILQINRAYCNHTTTNTSSTTTTIPGNGVPITNMARSQTTNSFINNFMKRIFQIKILKTFMRNLF